MSDQNIAAVRRLTQEGFVAGKVDVVDDVVAEDCVDHDPLPGQGQGRHPESRRLFEEIFHPARAVEHRVLGVGVDVNETVGHQRLP